LKKAIVATLVLAAAAALAWFIVQRGGGGGSAPSLAAALDATHTVGVFGAEDLDKLAKEAEGLLAQLPEEMRKEAPPELLDPAKRNEKLGFDPTSADGWKSIGVDPAAGFAVAADLRFTSGNEPLPLLLARITDRDKLVATITSGGGPPITFSDKVGPSEVAQHGQERMLVGKRGDITVFLPLPKAADEKALRTQFDAFLGEGGPTLAADETFRAALKDGAPRPRVWTFAASAAAVQLPGLKDAGPADIVSFYTQRFRAVAFSVGPEGGGFRLLTDGEGAKALRQIAVPRRSAPQMSRYFPKNGWAVSRFTVNLTDLFDGIQALVPPSKGDVKGQILLAKNFLPMAIGVAYDDLAAAFTGHVALGIELPKAPNQVPPMLVVAGVADKEKADTVLKTLLGRAKDAGIESEAFELKGNPGYKLTEGGKTAVVVRAGDVLLGALDPAIVEAALDRSDNLSGTPAGKALDGDAIYAMGVGAGWLDAALAAASPEDKAGVEMLKKHLPVEGFAATVELDDQGLKTGGSGGVTVAAMTGIVAAIAIPSFVKYQRRAKTSEATMNVRRLFDGAVAYYNEEHVDAQGNVLPPGFPPSAPLTPADDYCKQGRDRFDPDPKAWDHPTWQALNFRLEDPHRYRYEFVSSSTGFTARAIGDLDCDGVYSTFERVGTLNEQGFVNGDAGMFTSNETE
jgi:hypothetical protein